MRMSRLWITNKNALKISKLLAWRLYKIKKWGDYFYTKHDLLAKGFSLPTLIYQWYFLYHIRWFVSELIQYVLATTGNMSAVAAYNKYCLYNIIAWKFLDLREMWWEHGASFRSLLKINCMLITRLICIQWKFTSLMVKGLLIKILLFFFDHWSVHLFQSN